eukprot:5345621-Prymnesium_polylepis.1
MCVRDGVGTVIVQSINMHLETTSWVTLKSQMPTTWHVRLDPHRARAHRSHPPCEVWLPGLCRVCTVVYSHWFVDRAFTMLPWYALV